MALHACVEDCCVTSRKPSPFAAPPPTHPFQAKGLQAEYTRATSNAASTGTAGDSDDNEAGRLRGRVDELMREKKTLETKAEEALAAKRTAQAQVAAISAQGKVGGVRVVR